MRGRMLMLAAGMKIGQARAEQQSAQAAAYKQQGAAEAIAQKTAAAPPAQDFTAELQKLADMHKQGILTDEEFSAMKKKLLGI